MIKKAILLPLILFLALIVSHDYFQTGFPYTHDGENHLARFANYKVAVREGQFPPRFAPNLVNHYGYPVFNYNYPLANLLSLPFSFAKMNYELTYKLLVIFFLGLGMIGFTNWLVELQVKLGGVFFGLLVYVASPYLWSILLYRGNIGELMAYALFPWLLYLIEKYRRKKVGMGDIVMTSGFLLAHNSSVLFGLPLVFVYGLARYKLDFKYWRRWLTTMLVSVGATLWFWLPAVVEKNLVSVGQVGLVDQYLSHFPSLEQLLFSVLGFGFSQPGSIDSLSFHLGYVQLLGFIFASLALIKHKLWSRENKTGVWLWLALVMLFLFQLKVTAPIWQALPLVKFIQFPWRLSLFMGSLLGGFLAISWKHLGQFFKRLLWLVLIFQLGGLFLLKPVDYFHRENVDYEAFSQSTTTQNENTPITFTYTDIGEWQPGPILSSGEATFNQLLWRGSNRQYQVQVEETAHIIEPTMYFLGWQTQARDLSTQDWRQLDYIDNHQVQGRISYQLEPGTYQIESRFTQETWPRVLGNTLSAATWLVLFYLWLSKKFNPQKSLFFVWVIGLFSISFVASDYLAYRPSFPYADAILAATNLPRWLYSWANFDGVHYLTIINQGYEGVGLIQAFFPAWPLLIKFSSLIVHQSLLLGLSLNLVFTYLLLQAWGKLVKIDYKKINPWISVGIWLLFPTSFFFHAFYTEAFFLWLILTAFYQARKGNWWQAGLVTAIASATRVVGVLLVPALIYELWTQTDQDWRSLFTKHHTKLLGVLVGVLGLGGYMLYLNQTFGDPLYFFHVQSEFGGGRQESLVLYPQVVWRYLKILWQNQALSLSYVTTVQEFLAGTLGLLGIIFSWFKVRRSYVVFSLLAFLVPTLTGTFSSMPRYVLVSFSLMLWLAIIFSSKPRLAWLWFCASTILLVFNTMLFIQGYWVA